MKNLYKSVQGRILDIRGDVKGYELKRLNNLSGFIINIGKHAFMIS